MAESPTSEQLEVRRKGRQRLIGAVVIVLLAVVFVPMVLDPEPNRVRKEPSLAIPSKEGAAPLPAPTPAKAAPEAAKPAAPPADAKPAPATAKVATPLEAKVLESKPASIPAPAPASVAAASAPAPAPGTAKLPTVAPKLEGFAIQVGAFRDEEKLKQARDKLTAAKIAHFTERLPTSDLTRVRAGPYPTREAAEKALAAVTLAGLEGKVVPLP